MRDSINLGPTQVPLILGNSHINLHNYQCHFEVYLGSITL